MALITIETKINIDDYVTEISDKELIREIKRRAKVLGKSLDDFIKKSLRNYSFHREKKSLRGSTNG